MPPFIVPNMELYAVDAALVIASLSLDGEGTGVGGVPWGRGCDATRGRCGVLGVDVGVLVGVGVGVAVITLMDETLSLPI